MHDAVPSEDLKQLAEGVRVHWVGSSLEDALRASGALDSVFELLQLLFASVADIMVSGLSVILEPSVVLLLRVQRTTADSLSDEPCITRLRDARALRAELQSMAAASATMGTAVPNVVNGPMFVDAPAGSVGGAVFELGNGCWLLS
eukprot:4925750-Prymnesium_polylepis.1